MHNKSLPHTVMSGLSWTYFSTVSVGIMQLLVLILLSRLLSPQEIGLFAMVTLLSTVVEKVGHLGIAPVLVQKLKVDRDDRSIANTIAVIFGLSVAMILLCYRGSIANFIGDERLAELLPGASLIILLDSLISTSESMMQREMMFRQLSWCELISYAFGNVLVAITLAMIGFGVWSLILAAIVVRLIKCALIWRLYPPVLTLQVFNRKTRELLKLGLGFSAGRFFNYLALQGDNFVVGKILGAATLGVYSRSYQLISLPADFMGKAFDKVWFSALSKRQGDLGKMRMLYIASVEIVALICIPFSVIMTVFSREMISLLLGGQWMAAIPIVQLLAPGVFLRAAYKPSDTLARSMGASYPLARRQIIYAAAVVCGVFFGASFNGIHGAAFGVLGALVLHFFLASQLAWRIVRFPLVEFGKAHLPGFWLALALTLGLMAVDLAAAISGVTSGATLILKLLLLPPISIVALLSSPKTCRALHAARLIRPHLGKLKLPAILVSAVTHHSAD